jgi:hypothetical protein
MADDQGDSGTGQGLAERARQNAEANAYVTQRDHPSTPTEPASNPYATTPQDKVTNQRPAPKGEKATYKQASDILKKSLKLYDKGGKVSVNPADGKHEVAILKDGERVLTPEQNKDWEHAKNLGGVDGKAPTTLPIGGKTMRDANDVTPDVTPKKVYDKGGVVGDKDTYHHGDYSPTEKSEFHRSMSSLHTGGLHRALGIAEGERIPMAKIEAATHSENAHTRKMATLAKSMKGWKHGK